MLLHPAHCVRTHRLGTPSGRAQRLYDRFHQLSRHALSAQGFVHKRALNAHRRRIRRRERDLSDDTAIRIRGINSIGFHREIHKKPPFHFKASVT